MNHFIKRKFLSINVILTSLIVAYISLGFSSWTITSGLEGIDESKNITSDDLKESNDSFKLKLNKSYDKTEFLENVDTDLIDSNQIDKLEANLSWTNNKSNSNYSGNLTDYFYLYDSKNPASENSPHLLNEVTDEKLYLENHKITLDSGTTGNINSTMYYSNVYDLVDTSKTTFDKTEIDRQMKIICNLINPQNGTEVIYGECAINYNYLKVYYTRTTTNSNTYEFRYHFFYHVKGSDDICRYDTSYSGNGIDTSTDASIVPTITINSITTSQANKDTNFNINYTATNLSSGTKRSINLLESRFSTSAGNDSNYDILDLNKTNEDFQILRTGFENFCKTYANSIKPTVSNATVEIEYIDQDSEGSNINNFNNPWVYVTATRYKITSIQDNVTYYNGLRYYFFYYRMQDNKVNVLSINNTTGLGDISGSVYNSSSKGYDANYSITNPDWPLMITRTNNGESYNFDGQTSNSNSNYSALVPYSRYSRSYLRYLVTYKKNDSSNYSTISSNLVYFDGGDYFNNINKSKTKDDFNKEALINYLVENNGYYNSLPSGTETIFEEYTSEEFPYLYFLLSKRKTSDNKYYYYAVNVFCYFTLDNTSNNSQIKLSQFNYQTNVNNASSDETFNFTLHGENDANPTYISDSYHDEASYIYFDVEYMNVSNLVTVNNGKHNIGNNAGASYSSYKLLGYNFNEEEKVEEIYNNYYNFLNSYNIYYEIDNSRMQNFNAYIKDNTWYFSGYYTRKNVNSFTTFNNHYTFSNSLYQRRYSSGGTNNSGKNIQVTTSELNEDYYLDNVEQLYLSQKEFILLDYNFKNGVTGDLKTYTTQVFGLGVRAKAKAYQVLDRNNSDKFNFEYTITLIPKNDEVKSNMQNILKCFDFNLNVDIKQYGVYR